MRRHAHELARLEFEPDKAFETLIPEVGLLVGGAIDVIRLDDPPSVTILDFKSGDSDHQTGSGLTRDLMRTQIGVYCLAARRELECETKHGLVRYIGEPDPRLAEFAVDLADEQLTAVQTELSEIGRRIKRRNLMLVLPQ